MKKNLFENVLKYAPIFATVATASMVSFSAQAQQQPPYACQRMELDVPNPTDKLGALTQGLDGFFFRTNPDLNWGFFLSNEISLLLRDLNTALAQRGTTLVILPIPPRGLVAQNYVDFNTDRRPVLTVAEGGWMFDTYVKTLEQSGAIVPNLMDALRLNPAEAPRYYFKRDLQWRPEGARFTAEIVAQEIRTTGALQGILTRGFQTTTLSENTLTGALAKSAQRLCDQNLPPESYSEFVTREMGSLTSSRTPSPDVVLVGNGFSANERFNFAGFLSQSLGQPVSNQAVYSTREFNSIETYLASPAFFRTPPKVLIWQVPATLDLNRYRLELRQLATATFGGCTNSPVAQAESEMMNLGGTFTLPILATTAFKPSENYIHISTSNPAMNSFVVAIEYADGDSEWIPVERSGRFENSGDYFMSFSPDITSIVTSISVEQLSEAASVTRIEVCRK